MRVAIVTDSYHPTKDGVVASVDITKACFDANGIESVIIAPDPGREEDRIDGVRYFKSVKFKKYNGYFVPIYPSKKTRILKKIAPDIVHIEGVALMALKGIVAAHHLKIPVVLTFHTMVGDTMKYYSPVKMSQKTSDKLVWRYIRYITCWVDAIIAPSKSIEEEIRSKGIKNKIKVIPTPINTKLFSPSDGKPIREKYGIADKKIAISVGRISFEKNLDLIIKTLPLLDKDVVLMLVGEGPAKDSLVELATNLGVLDRIIFTGFVDSSLLPGYYSCADVFVVASRFETQCLSALEAMACGVPVVGASDRALKDYIVDGKNGYLFDNTVEDCCEKIKLALESKDSIKEEAAKTVSEFSEKSFIDNTLALYNEVIEEKRGKKNV